MTNPKPDNLTCQEIELRRLNGPKTDEDVEAMSDLKIQTHTTDYHNGFHEGYAAGRAEREGEVERLREALEIISKRARKKLNPDLDQATALNFLCFGIGQVAGCALNPPAQEGETNE